MNEFLVLTAISLKFHLLTFDFGSDDVSVYSTETSSVSFCETSTHFSAAAKKAVILSAMQFWEDNVCINFEPAQPTDTNGLNFVSQSGCWSYIGQINGMQPVSIGDGCEYVNLSIGIHKRT